MGRCQRNTFTAQNRRNEVYERLRYLKDIRATREIVAIGGSWDVNVFFTSLGIAVTLYQKCKNNVDINAFAGTKFLLSSKENSVSICILQCLRGDKDDTRTWA